MSISVNPNPILLRARAGASGSSGAAPRRCTRRTWCWPRRRCWRRPRSCARARPPRVTTSPTSSGARARTQPQPLLALARRHIRACNLSWGTAGPCPSLANCPGHATDGVSSMGTCMHASHCCLKAWLGSSVPCSGFKENCINPCLLKWRRKAWNCLAVRDSGELQQGIELSKRLQRAILRCAAWHGMRWAFQPIALVESSAHEWWPASCLSGMCAHATCGTLSVWGCWAGMHHSEAWNLIVMQWRLQPSVSAQRRGPADSEQGGAGARALPLVRHDAQRGLQQGVQLLVTCSQRSDAGLLRWHVFS